MPASIAKPVLRKAFTADTVVDERVYVLYDNDPEELLDGYAGKLAISPYEKSRR